MRLYCEFIHSRSAFWADSIFVCSFSFSFVSFARLAITSFSFARFPACSFRFARSALGRLSFARFPARSFLFRWVVFRSLDPHPSLCPFFFAFRCSFTLPVFQCYYPSPLCAPFLVHLDVQLYLCVSLCFAITPALVCDPFAQRDNPRPCLLLLSALVLALSGPFCVGWVRCAPSGV